MKVTYTLKDLSDVFYAKLEAMTDRERFDLLNKYALGDLKHAVKQKVGSGQFRDKVELNQIMRGNPTMVYKLEPRKGYKLATFEITQSR